MNEDVSDIPFELVIQYFIDKCIVERLGYRFDKETWKKAHLGKDMIDIEKPIG